MGGCHPPRLCDGTGAELHRVASTWPMKRLVAIWNRLPGVPAVARFTDRKTAIARIWRAIQPPTEADRQSARPRHSKAQPRPMFREGSKAAQVWTLLCRPEGATLHEIRNQTGWQAHTVRGFISRNLSKQSCKVRSFEREGDRVYRLKTVDLRVARVFFRPCRSKSRCES